MAEEKKKSSWFGIKNIVTGAVCAVVGAGISVGVIDSTKLNETISRAEARKIVVATAAYSAEQSANAAIAGVKADVSVAEKAKVVIAAVKSTVEQSKAAADSIIDGVKSDASEGGLTKENVEAAKEEVSNAKAEVKAAVTDVKEKVDAAKAKADTKAATDTAANKTEAKASK